MAEIHWRNFISCLESTDKISFPAWNPLAEFNSICRISFYSLNLLREFHSTNRHGCGTQLSFSFNRPKIEKDSQPRSISLKIPLRNKTNFPICLQMLLKDKILKIRFQDCFHWFVDEPFFFNLLAPGPSSPEQKFLTCFSQKNSKTSE